MPVEDRWHSKDQGRKVRSSRYGTGLRWRARWNEPGGRQRSRSFPRQLDAERFLADVEAAKHRGAYLDPDAGRITLREYAETRWLTDLVHVRPNTLSSYTTNLNTHVLPALGHRPLGSLKRADVRTFVGALSRKLAPTTVGNVVAVLRIILQAAADDGVIPANPALRVGLPTVEPRVVEPLPLTAVRALADSITPRYRVAVFLGAGVGLREGEAAGLTVGRVDFLRRRVAVERQWDNQPLKTKASRRVVPVDDVVLEEVAAHLARWPSKGYLMTNRSGRRVQKGSFGFCWREAVAKAGLPEGTRFHDLRHFYASSLIAAGVHPRVIQARLGHATMAETMDTYGHLFPDSEDAGRGALDVLRPPDTTTGDANG